MPTSRSTNTTPVTTASSRPADPPRPHARPDDRALLTVKDVARLDGCSEKTVRRAIAAGLLVALRVGPGGRLVRITPAAHRAYRQAGVL